MKFYTEYNMPDLWDASLIRTDRNVINPLPGLTFVSITYYELNGETIGIIF